MIQYNFEKYFDITLTATYLGFIVATSRIARIFGNVIFRKLYTKYKDRVNLILPVTAMIAFVCVLVGSYCSVIIAKFILMTIGFDMILAIRDPVELYASDLLLKNAKPQEQQKAISYLQLSRRIGESMMSLLFSMLLIKIDLIYVVICLLVFALLSLGVNTKLYKMIKE